MYVLVCYSSMHSQMILHFKSKYEPFIYVFLKAVSNYNEVLATILYLIRKSKQNIILWK